MNNKVKDDWNAGSDQWYADNASDDVINKIISDPMWAFPTPVRAMLLSAFPGFRGKHVLVPSSGNNVAAFAFHLLGAQVTSSDFAERQLENAKRIAVRHDWNIEYVCNDSMVLPDIKDREYDLIYTSNGVHVWIPDLPGMYRSFYRALKPGGLYIMFELHPFNRPFTEDENDSYRIKSAKPYEETGPFEEIPRYHWRIQDLANAMTGTGFSIQRMEEFHSEIGTHDCWWYSTPEEAETDGYRKSDWRQNPWAALPQWIGFSAQKPEKP